jgi:uncharacterized lipoprotein YajG
MKSLIVAIVLLSGCAAQDLAHPVCVTAHSPSVETSDGVKIPSRSTRVCSAYIVIDKP